MSTQTRASAFFLTVLMALMPLSSVMQHSTVETTVPSSAFLQDLVVETSSPSAPFFVDQFVEGAAFFSTERPIDVAVGYYHACFLFDDGRLSCSGYNLQGQLGMGEPSASPYRETLPVEVAMPSDITIESVATGWDSTCAIDSEGQVWCWGDNSNQKLNVQSTDGYVYGPELVEFPTTPHAVELAVGRHHQCILDDNSDIYCWGRNNNGQLGLGNYTSYVRTPTKVDLPSNLVPVSVQARSDFTCMLTTERSVYCWGQNGGHLGDGTTDNKNRPSQVLLPFTDKASVLSVGYRHSCVLSVDANPYCWGNNNYGQLGTKSTWSSPSEHLVPIQIDVFGDVIDIEVGYEHTCALTRTQSIVCWGLATTGQLGYGSNTQTTDHKYVNFGSSYGFSNPILLSSGIHTTCSIFDNGKIGCWGQNNQGQIGDGSTSVRSSAHPSSITVGPQTSTLTFTSGVGKSYVPYVDGMNYTVQVSPSLPSGFTLDTSTGGLTFDGQMPPGSSTHNLTFAAGFDEITIPITLLIVQSVDLGGRIQAHLSGIEFTPALEKSTIRSISSTKDHTCLTQVSHEMHCWGDVEDKKLGISSSSDVLTPTMVASTSVRHSPIVSVGQEHTCSLPSPKALYCWGMYEEIYGSSSTSINPTNILSSQLYELIDLSSQYSHTCFLNSAGEVMCFGKNNAGQLGLAYTDSYRSPSQVTAVNFPDQGKAVSMAAGYEFSCGLMRNGSVYCWGANNFGQLGDGTSMDSSVPVLVQLSRPALAISLGQSHACALLDNNDLMCWGRNNVGQLGINSLTDAATPTKSQLPASSTPVVIDAGTSHTCTVLVNGSLYCWGLNSDGQLGDGTTTFRKIPVQSQLPIGYTAAMVAVGESHTCVVSNRSSVHCIGSNDQGQLGDGSTSNSNAYVQTAFNEGVSTETWNLVQGYESQLNILVSGWGPTQLHATNLPQGISLQGSLLQYDGVSPVSNLTFTLTVSNDDRSLHLAVSTRAMDAENLPGVLPSYISEIGFLPPTSTSNLMPRDMTSGVYSGCIIDADGRLECWGVGTSYQHGVGSTSTRSTPITVASHIEFSKVESGFYHVCGIDVDLQLWCWGRGGLGQIGVGSNNDAAYPVHIDAFGEGVLQTSLSGERTCALTLSRQVYCWGSNSDGEIDRSGVSSYNMPRHVQSVSNFTIESISAAQDHTCAILDNGSTVCWGQPSQGAMGDNAVSVTSEELRWPLLPSSKRAVAISSGFLHTCTLMDDASVYCWGSNQYGQVGSGSTTNQPVPVEVLSSSDNVVGISLDNAHSCAWLANGTGMCWGYNADYRLGIGNTTNMPVPTQVLDHSSNALPDKRIIHMDAGFANSCAMYYDGSISCWGRSHNSLYGNGDGANSNRAAPVSFVSGFSPTGSMYAGSSSLSFVEGRPSSLALHVVGWGGEIALSSPLPTGLFVNVSNGTMEYDGSSFQPTNIVFSVTDSFGTRQESFSVASYAVQPREGRINSPILLNASANTVESRASLVALDAGEDHACTIDRAEHLMCWGRGDNGRLGSGNTGHKTAPYLSTSYYSQHPWTQLALGDRHSCGLDQHGHLYCWGASNLYQNGYDTSDRYDPYQHSWQASEIYGDSMVSLSAGGDSTCAIREDFTLWCWGMNNAGQLGHGTYSQGTLPDRVELPSGSTPLSVSVGGEHACALDNLGAVYCWGANNHGQLGLGNNTQTNLPIQVTLPASTQAVAISSGDAHTCAILDDASISCWGYNNNGQVGDGTTDSRQSPTSVILSGQNDPVMINAGFSSTCALFDDGGIQCWGGNNHGQLGIGSNIDSASPQIVSSMNAFEAFDLSVGKEFACAAFHDGSVRCWGHNNYGQLGVGSTVSKNDPTLVSGYALGSDEFTFFSGMDHALPFHAAGWGFEAEVVSVLPPHFEWDNTSMTLNIGEHAQPGNITVDVAFSIPSGTISVQAGIELLEIIDPWSDRINAHTLGFGIIDDVDSNIPVEIESGDQATCVMYRGTKTQCIGNSQYGVLGSGSTSSLSSMANINAFSEPLRSISMNDNHACGIDVEFQLWCWGLNSYGQLGMGDTTQRTTPGGLSTDASGQPLGFAFVVETGFGGHTCGIIDRTTHCWGENDQGQLGDDSTTNRNRPVPVVSTDGTEFTDLALGYKHACGVAVNGSVYCWGYNNDGQLGDNSTTSSNVPVHVDVPSSAPVVAIDAGYRHTCALTGMNQVYCWGYNSQGSLGDGTTLNAHSPSQVQFPSLNGQHIVQLSSGEHFNCALLDNGTALCWGSNDYNQVEGDLSDHLSGVVTTPTFLNITESGYLSSLDLGKHHACAVLVNSDVKCWGATFAHVPRAAQRISTALNLINQTSASKLLYPQGWGVVTANLTSVPAAFDYTFPRLDVSPQTTSINALSWTITTKQRTLQGSLPIQWTMLDIYTGKSDQWNNGIEYLTAESSLPMVDVQTGDSHACGIDSEGTMYCWGSNSYGKLGDGSQSGKVSPSLVRFADSSTSILKTGIGYYHTCAISSEGRVFCWGYNNQGQLGIGSTTPSFSLSPKEVRTPWSTVAVDIALAHDFACVLMNQGSVWCWGTNSYEQLGNQSASSSSSVPVGVDLPKGRYATSINAAEHHACAVLDDGSVYCWGRYSSFNMGSRSASTTVNVQTPEEVLLPRHLDVVSMDIGTYHGCALMSDTSLWCWGENQEGQVGVGYISDGTDSQAIRYPTEIDVRNLPPIVEISANYQNTCALHDTGDITCWGRNHHSQVGDGTTAATGSPTSVFLGSTKASFVSVGRYFACAGTDDGSINCWGYNGNGQIGSGNTQTATYPEPLDMEKPTFSPVLTFLEGDASENLAYISGWHYTLDVSPSFPTGFTLDPESGTIRSTNASTFGVSRHNITVTAGSYSSTVEVTIVVIRDSDGDGIADTEDYDDDDDGHLDSLDNCPLDYGTSTSGGYIGCPDGDGDGWADLIDPFVDDDTQWKDTDGDGYGDNPLGNDPDMWVLDASQWFDTDDDGFGDNEFGTRGDACPTVQGNSTLDIFGCPDTDGDGWSDEGDSFPLIGSQYADRDGDGWGDNQSEGAEQIDAFPSDGTQWEDADGDGHGDNKYGTEGDWFPEDPTRWADSDRDGYADEDDAFVNDATQWFDRDGDLYGDNPLGNRADTFPDDPSEWLDTDGDGVGNNADAFPFDPTQVSDSDGDGYGDNPLGTGADVFPNNPTQWEDKDGDGLGDNQTGTEADPYLSDFDNDGYNDSIDVLPSLYSPGDMDNDGYPDDIDWAPADYREWADNDGDGEGDNADTDDDNDGWADTDEVRQGTDPLSSTSQPIDSFEIVLPGTAIGLGAWDLIGIFGGVPLFAWIGFGFATRNKRTAKYVEKLKAATTRDELEKVAFQWEYSLMLRLLGPHQGIRLERLRAELDDRFEAQNQKLSSIEPHDYDHTHYVEEAPETDGKELPTIQPYAYEQTVAPSHEVAAEPAPEDVQVHAHAVQEHIAPEPTSWPDRSASPHMTDENGYEWVTMADGTNYYRISGSMDEWSKFDA